mmetsp:Transcript_39819/g.38366  ORF Transcript_39819/g.38366 Transcript_39819/m.38366 type:complete len:94 (+) Transcript_39819:449-730(+)
MGKIWFYSRGLSLQGLIVLWADNPGDLDPFTDQGLIHQGRLAPFIHGRVLHFFSILHSLHSGLKLRRKIKGGEVVSDLQPLRVASGPPPLLLL